MSRKNALNWRVAILYPADYPAEGGAPRDDPTFVTPEDSGFRLGRKSMLTHDIRAAMRRAKYEILPDENTFYRVHQRLK